MKKHKTLIIVSLVLVAAVGGYVIYKKKQQNLPASSGNTKSFSTDRYIVGGYSASTNRTWIFREGHLDQGFYVVGPVTVPQGTLIWV